MSNFLASLQAQAALAAETGPDMNEAVKGGGGGKLLPEGPVLGRLVEYVEYGSHVTEFKGVAKEPAPQFRLGFALYGEGVAEADGTPYVQRTYQISLSRNEKAKAFLLFKRMNWKGTHTHFAQMLGEAFVLSIENTAPKSDPTGKKTSKIKLDSFAPPIDVMSKQPYPVPVPADSFYKLFLWDHPTAEGWKALEIEGQRDDGTSKNYIQEEILSAVDFQGSALQIMLATNNIPYVVPAPKAKAAAPATPAAAAPNVQPAAPAAVAPTMPATPVLQPSTPSTAASPVAAAPAPASAPVAVATPAVATPAVAPVATAPVAANAPAMPVLPVLPVAA